MYCDVRDVWSFVRIKKRNKTGEIRETRTSVIRSMFFRLTGRRESDSCCNKLFQNWTKRIRDKESVKKKKKLKETKNERTLL